MKRFFDDNLDWLTPVDESTEQNEVPREESNHPNQDKEAKHRATGGRVEASNINHKPSERQKEAGNYAKDHVNIHGLSIAIENAKGSQRSGIGADGKAWKSTLPAHYGYVKRTEGADGDAVDVYLGPHLKSNKVFIIDQVDEKSKRFDEHKVMIGFGTKFQALDTYRKAFSDGKGKDRIGAVHETDIAGLRAWLKDGHTTQPIHKDLKGRRSDERIKRDAFLYMEPKGNGKDFAQCSTCVEFDPKTKCCVVMNKIVAGLDSCGIYLEGKYDGRKPKEYATPAELGYVQREVRCENCKYGGDECWLYKMLNQRQPEDFDLETKIHPKACCNLQTPKE